MVRVEIGSREDYASVIVSDTGRGIPAQNIPKHLPAFLHHQG